MEIKICTKCGRELPATTEYFYRHSTDKDDLTSSCKICRTAHQKTYYEGHREEIIAYQKAYRESHKEKIIVDGKVYYENHKEKIVAQQKNYREAHKEERAIYSKTHKEELANQYKAWNKANPDKARSRQLRRRAHKQVATIVDFSLIDWLASQPRLFRCYLCDKLIRKNQKYHIEHRIPLARGGVHAPWNLGIAHDRCNLLKHTKTPSEYLPHRFQPELAL